MNQHKNVIPSAGLDSLRESNPESSDLAFKFTLSSSASGRKVHAAAISFREFWQVPG
jgi:hypothetical protein